MSEHAEQVALFRWAALMRKKYPELALMYAIPNAARRSPRQGAWMKAEGMKAGVPDVHLPVSNGSYIGLWIEMKVTTKPTKAQSEWMKALAAVGHKCAVCYSWGEARAVIEEYLAHGAKEAA